jgi:hypothetical protein
MGRALWKPKLSHRDLANRNRVAGTALADLHDFMRDNLANRIIAIHQVQLTQSSDEGSVSSSKRLIGIGESPAASKLTCGQTQR